MKGKFSELINSDTPVLIDFYADWCGPCKMVTPILHQLKEKVGDAVRVIKLDIDKNPKIAEKFGIRSVPTLMLFKSGDQKWRKSGVVPIYELEKIVEANR